MCHSLEVYKYTAVADRTTVNELAGPTSKWLAYFIKSVYKHIKTLQANIGDTSTLSPSKTFWTETPCLLHGAKF